jgi:hypothetical protein
MSNLAQEVTRALGGEWCGSYGLAAGPGHDKHDRSLTIRPHRTDPDDIVLHSFAGDDWQSIKDELRRRKLLPDKGFRRAGGPDPVAREAAKAEAREWERQQTENKERKRQWVNRLWRNAEPAEGTVVEGYLTNTRRLKNPPLDVLRYLPAGLAGQPYPAMLAAFGLPDEPEPGKLRLDDVSGIHLTFLDGIKKAPVTKPKVMHGACKGLPIVLAPPNDGLALCIGEGIETTCRLNERLNMGAWAAGSASFFPALAAIVPNYIECGHIAVDSDAAGAGERHATALAELLSERGIDAYLVEAA